MSSEFIPVCNSVIILLLNTINVFPCFSDQMCRYCFLTHFCPDSVAYARTALCFPSWEALI